MIEKDAVLKILSESFFRGCLPITYLEVCDKINNLPEFNIVLCRGCKHYDSHDHRCMYFNHGVKDWNYCCFGEVKHENN